MNSKTEPKIRFVCNLPDQQSELFWIKEKKNGGLTLMIKSGPFYEPNILVPEKIALKSSKYSVHRSIGGTTLHQTTTLEDGTTVDTAAFQKDSPYKLFWPIFAKACQDLSARDFAVQKRPSDTLVSVASLPINATLVYCVVIASRGCGKSVAAMGLMSSVTSFQFFDVLTFATVMVLPAATIATVLHCSTNSPRLNGQHVFGDLRGSVIVDPKPLQFGAGLAVANLHGVAAEHFAKVLAQMPSDLAKWIRSQPDAGKLLNVSDVVKNY